MGVSTRLAKQVQKTVLAAGLVISVCAGALAQEVSEDHINAAKAALKSGESTRNLDNILPNLARRMKDQLILSQPNLDQEISDIVDNATIEMAPRRGDLENEVARLYATVFTQEELVELKTFYDSAAGKKLLKESPILIREIAKASKTWTAGVDRDLRAEVAKKMQELASKNKDNKGENSSGN